MFLVSNVFFKEWQSSVTYSSTQVLFFNFRSKLIVNIIQFKVPIKKLIIIFDVCIFIIKYNFSIKDSFFPACTEPSDITDGDYDVTISDKYALGDAVSFTCYGDALARPASKQIECGENGWKKNATCIRSWLFIFTNDW